MAPAVIDVTVAAGAHLRLTEIAEEEARETRTTIAIIRGTAARTVADPAATVGIVIEGIADGTASREMTPDHESETGPGIDPFATGLDRPVTARGTVLVRDPVIDTIATLGAAAETADPVDPDIRAAAVRATVEESAVTSMAIPW